MQLLRMRRQVTLPRRMKAAVRTVAGAGDMPAVVVEAAEGANL
jgi:hypothetical protein